MKKLFLGLLFALAVFTFSAHGSFAQSNATTGFSGKAMRWNGDPISGATISILAGPLETDQEYARTTTAADGSWSVAVPAGGPYWVHIHTLGTWWGYSYQTPFTLTNGEQVSQIFLALGPRDVKEIALPTPVSNVGDAVGEDNEPTPVSNVGPAIGVGDDDIPVGMPSTGGADEQPNYIQILIVAGTLLAVGGLAIRYASRPS